MHKKISLHHETIYQLIYADKRADRLATTVVSGMKALKSKAKTITFDNGLEFAHHQDIAKGLGTNIYFAHPYCSWERGTNEHQ